MRQVRAVSLRTPALYLAFTVVAVVLMLVPFATRPTAQSPAPAAPALVQLMIVDVKPDSWEDYLAMQKAETVPALKKAGIERRSAWKVQGLGRGYRIAYLYPVSSLGIFDGPGPMVKAFGEDGAKAYYAKVRRFVSATKTVAIRTRPDLGFPGEAGPPPKLGVVAHVLAIPGKQFDFEGTLKDQWVPALKKAGVPLYMVHEVLVGGEMGEYYTFTPIANFAALDTGHPIMKALGQAEYAALLGKMGATLRSVEREVYKFDDDLSFDTKAASTK